MPDGWHRMLASLLVLDVLVKLGKPVSEIIGGIRKYESSGEINFRIARKKEAMEALKAHFTAQEDPTAFFDFDGYRIEFAHWWFNVRPSNTEPYLRFIAEAANGELLSEKLGEMRMVLKPYL